MRADGSGAASTVVGVDWLDAHHGTVTAASAAVLTLAVLALAWALLRSVRQGRAALLGARPVPRAPEFGPGPEGGLALVIPLANTSSWPAQRLSARLRINGRAVAGGVDGETLFGGVPGVPIAASSCRPVFAWPMGVLEASVDLRWSWRDGAGRHRARWQGHVRVPEQVFPQGE